jgi:LacI family transcriptional regulator
VAEHGPWLLYLEPRDLRAPFPEWLEGLPGAGVLSSTGSEEMLERLKASRLPVVELRDASASNPFPFVGMDNSQIGRRVAEHFRGLGYRRFAGFLDGSQVYFRERIEGFAQALGAEGFECPVFESPVRRPRWDRFQRELADWLQRLEKPVAVFASNDQLAFWLADAAQQAGISVPEQLAVMGAENDRMLCESAWPQLSSVQFRGQAAGYAAAELLDGWIRSGRRQPPVRQVLLPLGDIVVRQSSDIVAVEDPRLARALEFIRRNAHTGVAVDDVARAAGLSRSALERRMRSQIGRSPGEQLSRVRFECVERLLMETDLTLAAIAERAGFEYPQYMAEAFHRRTGITPGEFRARRKI